MDKKQLNEELLESAIRGNLEKMKECLKNGADVNYQESIEGRTALIYACRNDIAKNQFEMVETLIKHGADVNQCDKYNRTPLLYTAKEDKININIVKLLVENGADVNIKDQMGYTALSWCISDIFRMYEPTNLNALETMKYLISNGADVNVKNNFGETPLIISASYANIEASKILMANGADLNIKNNDGKTALMIANNELKQGKDEYKAIQSLLKGHTDLEKAISKSKAKDRAKIKSKSKSNDYGMGM